MAASADDFLSLPFTPTELTARLKALLRRRHQQRLPSLVVGPLTFDQTHRKIYLRDHEMSLTPKEFGILELLIRRAECVVSRSELVETVWCDTLDAMLSHRLESHISQLRKKLGNRDMIRAYSGRGYELVRHDQR